MGCDADAEVLDQFAIDTDIEVKPVWSPRCQATWAKVSIDPAYGDNPVFGELWTTPRPGGVEKPYITPRLGRDNPTEITLTGDWKATSKACWTLRDPELDGDCDPAPLILDDMSVVLAGINGACTEWI